jgi:hypothetical protein
MENQVLSAIDVLEGGPSLKTRSEKTLSDLVRERRATPVFSSAPVSEDHLRKILQLDSKHRAATTCNPGVSLWSAISSSESGSGLLQ